jgi:hypothetical protein
VLPIVCLVIFSSSYSPLFLCFAPHQICCLCQNEFVGFGNNPAPLEGDKCCDNCNSEKVIPARMQDVRNVGKEEEEEEEEMYDTASSIQLKNYVVDGIGRCIIFTTYTGGPSGGYRLDQDGQVYEWTADWSEPVFTAVEGQLWYNPEKVKGAAVDIVCLHNGQPEEDAIQYEYETLEKPDNWDEV